MIEQQSGHAAVQVRLEGPLFDRLEAWRRAQSKIPSRADALRQCLDRALPPAADVNGR
jgi:hypothetical protein